MGQESKGQQAPPETESQTHAAVGIGSKLMLRLGHSVILGNLLTSLGLHFVPCKTPALLGVFGGLKDTVDWKLWLPGGGPSEPVPDCRPLSIAESAWQIHCPTSRTPQSRALGFLASDQRYDLLLHFCSESTLSPSLFLPATIPSKQSWIPEP